MKWKLLCVLTINFISIHVIGCWPFIPPPPEPMNLFEDHYVRISHGPYDERGLTHMASHPSGQAFHDSSDNNMFYPMPPMVYSEPQERLFDSSSEFDLGNAQEFTEFTPREPVMKSTLRHMNYRYRKRMKSQRPIQHNAFTHINKKEVKYQMDGHQPRRYNVVDNRQFGIKKIIQNIPNSVNEKLGQNAKKIVFEEEINRLNMSSNPTDGNERQSDKHSKDLQQNGSQNRDIPNQSLGKNEVPVEITSYDMKTPDGAVTQVTEMIYNIENNPFKNPTTTPIMSPFLPPSSPAIHPVTDDPRVTQTPYNMNSIYSETEMGSTVPIEPINTAVSAQFNGITISPMPSWTNNPRSTANPLPTIWTNEPPFSGPTSPRQSSLPSDQNTRRARKRFSTQRPTNTPIRSSARESPQGLSGAAIAGIVIGSLVSIMLLAGVSLFVMYRNPFRTTIGHQRSSASIPPSVAPTVPNTNPRVLRWQPRRLRRS